MSSRLTLALLTLVLSVAEASGKSARNRPLRFRCHVGHSFTADPFLSEQTSYLEHILWSAVRAVEKVSLIRQVAQRMKDEGAHNVAMKYEEYAENVDKEVLLVRELILHGHATKRAIVTDDQDKTNGS